MTFDEWCEDQQAMYKSIEKKDDLHCLLKSTWEAAIKAAIELLETGSYIYESELTELRYCYGSDRISPRRERAEDELKKLLTT